MKHETPESDRLRALLERWCEGEHEESLAAEISALARDNPDLAWDYLCHMEMHAALRYQGQEESESHNEQSTIQPAASLPLAMGRANADSPVAPAGAGQWPWMAVVCAGLLGIVATVMFLISSRQNPREHVAVEETNKPAAPVVARLITAFDCEWEAASTLYQVGDLLQQGDTVAILAGYARIAFETGAVMTLQAPARLELNHANGVLLHHGVVTSEVPEQAKGFTVETVSSRIVDHGTEFGVAVDQSGSTALSVFRGMVEIAGRHRDALPARRVTAGQAIRLDRAGEMAEWREVDPRQFAPGCCDQDGTPDPNALPVQVRRFRHAGDLSFPDQVVAAINVGGTETLDVAGVRFVDDQGKHVTSPVVQERWGTRPWFGEQDDDVILSRLLYSIRNNLSTSVVKRGQPELADPVQVALPVEKGRYRVSLLLCENYHAREPFRDRSLNVDVEGRCCARDLRILAVQGIAGYPAPPNQAIVLSTEVDVTDETLDVLLFSRHVAENVDENVILNALVVERLD